MLELILRAGRSGKNKLCGLKDGLRPKSVLPLSQSPNAPPEPEPQPKLEPRLDKDICTPVPIIHSLLWVFETSTNPELISVASAMALDVEWPLGLNLGAALGRLRMNFISCFEFKNKLVYIRKGMKKYAIDCGTAYGLLNMSSTSMLWDDETRGLFKGHDLRTHQIVFDPDLSVVVHVLNSDLKSPWYRSGASCSAYILRWALRVLPHRLGFKSVHLNEELGSLLHSEMEPQNVSHADFLFCISTLLHMPRPNPAMFTQNEKW
jgi:hypothetical protein